MDNKDKWDKKAPKKNVKTYTQAILRTDVNTLQK